MKIKNTKNSTKTVTFWLPYHKQGDDMAQHLEENKNDCFKAIQAHKKRLLAAIERLDEVYQVLKNNNLKSKDIDIQADTHIIYITGPSNVMDELIKGDLAEKDEFDED